MKLAGSRPCVGAPSSTPSAARSLQTRVKPALPTSLHSARGRQSQICSVWLENRAEVSVQVPVETAWDLWDDKERIPDWMPWISSVQTDAQNPALSQWRLSTSMFGQEWSLSWLSESLPNKPHTQMQWRSVPGYKGPGGSLEVPNRGQLLFRRFGPESCIVELTIGYEVPGLLQPFASVLTPTVEGILRTDMQRFARYAVDHQARPHA
ncbi:hypothetical protein ACKKBF_B30865 [Auxenochlorella protothecoides x Auxenochlorella symbiontica]